MNTETLSLSEQMTLKRAARLRGCPKSWRGVLLRSWTKPSRKSAIAAFCGECLGFDRKAIAQCTAYACPLWNFRPFQTADEPTQSHQAPVVDRQ